MKSTFLGLAFSIGLSAPAAAMTLAETTDFGGLGFPSAVGSLDLGLNSISGDISAICTRYSSVNSECNGFAGDYVDAVSFDIRAGQELSSAVLTISALATDSAGTPQVYGESRSNPMILTNLGNGSYGVLNGPLAGTQNFGVISLLRNVLSVRDIGTVTFSWRLDLTTAPMPFVPVRFAVPFFLMVLGGWSLFRYHVATKG